MMRSGLALRFVAALAGAGCRPAQAFTLYFTPWETALIYLYLAWPVVLLILLVVLALMWPQRVVWRTAFGVVLGVAVLGSALWSVPWWQEVADSHRAREERRFWAQVDQAAAEGRIDASLRLLEDRGPQALQEYVARHAYADGPQPHPALLQAAFQRCADLLQGGILELDLLRQMIDAGRADVIAAWLDTPPCARADGHDRDAVLAQVVYHLLPYASSGAEGRERDRRQAQAAALHVLFARRPALLEVDVSQFGCGRYPGAYPRCTVLSQLFDTWHDAGAAAVLPLDGQAQKHLPAVALHLLRGEAAPAAEAARGDPELFHRLLPALIATAPVAPLRAAVQAAPPAETALLSPTDGQSLFQHLWPLFDAARRRDAEKPDWPFLWLSFDLFPSRLAEVDRSLYDGYLIGTPVPDARVQQMLNRLRTAGVACEELQSLTAWGDDTPQARAWYAGLTGCGVLPR